MKITDVEAIVLRQPALDDDIADGSQDDLVILVHTDEGITGIGEVDSAPEAVRALVQAPGSHAIANSLHDLLVGEDPLDVERLWQKMYRGLIYIGRRGIALHAISGIDIALWDIEGKVDGQAGLRADRHAAAARQGARLRLDADARRSRRVVRERVGNAARPGLHRGQARLGPARRRTPSKDVELVAAAVEAAGGTVTILIDAGHGYVDDAKRAIGVARELEELDVFWLEEPFLPDEYEAYAELADDGRHPRRRRRAGHDALGLPRADRARPRRPRPARRHALRRHHRDAAHRGVCARAAASRPCRTRGRAGSSRPRRCT